jgi:hypothetical protein
MNTAKAKDLYDKIPKFSGQKEDVQLEEVVQQINFADLVQWVDNEDGENGAIGYLFRELLTGKADQNLENDRRRRRNQSQHLGKR